MFFVYRYQFIASNFYILAQYFVLVNNFFSFFEIFFVDRLSKYFSFETACL